MLWFIIGIALVTYGVYLVRNYDSDHSFTFGVSGVIAGVLILIISFCHLIYGQVIEYKNFKIKYDEITSLVNRVDGNDANVLLGTLYNINAALEQKKLNNKRFPLFNDWFVDDRFEDLETIKVPEHLTIKK